MVWPFFDLNLTAREPWRDLRQLQREMDRLFSRYSGDQPEAAGFPAVNLFGNDEKVIVTAEIPGLNADDLNLSVQDNQLTIRGSRGSYECTEGEVYHRRERGAGEFVRAVNLPYRVDAGKVEASYKLGVLQVTLPRAEEDKPKKIAIKV